MDETDDRTIYQYYFLVITKQIHLINIKNYNSKEMTYLNYIVEISKYVSLIMDLNNVTIHNFYVSIRSRIIPIPLSYCNSLTIDINNKNT